ncbi:beta-lactamase/transpeptidase-like protein [Mollisia scopiformis]|uniref:Beta-lactamase/transpeptidase-like protein n=1 Tax=Mollisia scopiformis TaxID=149040 RepID=A0A194WZC3_MOLSC|nr:beta-lactamase/transpeptidase-like protein [Mollisia scopiformis]KUJ12952.1 beta-lactamase/transpeptidase-like protein [Mollisia scopiformis]
MAPHTLSSEGASKIREAIDSVTSDPKTQIPGFVFVSINNQGDELIAHASGHRGADSKQAMDLESVFWIASCTKMVGGIACLQAVERGVLGLDDGEQVEKLCPELKRAKILKGFDENDRPILVEKKNKITLRMLLSHTAGFGYTFFNPEIRKFGLPKGLDEFSGDIKDIEHPLLFEPGTKWNYGTSIDWACILLERATGDSLSTYIQTNIFSPLKITNMSFFPPDEMKQHLAHMNQRYPDGHLTEREHLLRKPLYEHTDEQKKGILNSAGAGLFAQPREYVKIIAMLLNDGTCPKTRAQILKPSTIAEMFTNQIPSMPNFAREPIAAATPELTNPIPELYPQPREQEQGWGLTFMLTVHEGATGRGRNTAWWAGLANLFWWADRERGVGGMVASQILPFAGEWFCLREEGGVWANCV